MTVTRSLREVHGRRPNRGPRTAHLAHEEVSAERWLLTYSDMITLLMVLFIVLYAISTISQAKYQEFKQSITKAMDTRVPQGTTTVAPINSEKAASAVQPVNLLAKIEAEITANLKARNLLQDVTFSLTQAGLTVGLVADSTFFGTDSADLSPVGKDVVDTASSVLVNYPNAIEVAGYTDNEPILAGPYPNNWALSAARATTVLLRMTQQDGINPSHIVLIGYGEYHKFASNATPAGQAQNRRVDIVISPSPQFTP